MILANVGNSFFHLNIMTLPLAIARQEYALPFHLPNPPQASLLFFVHRVKWTSWVTV